MVGRQDEWGAMTHRSLSSRQDRIYEENRLLAAAERKELAAQKFDEWVRFKDNFDRGLALFSKLDGSHCEGENAWHEVAVILAAIDRSLGIDLNVAVPTARHGNATKVSQTKAGPQTMFDAFKKWSMSGHTFKFVKLTPSEVESLGAATRQFLEAKGEDDEAVMVLPSLKYHFPPPPARRGLRTRPMTDDQKAMNTIFMRRIRAGWKAANREMREQLAKYVEDAETTYQAKRLKALGLKNPAVETRELSAEAANASGNAESGESKEKESKDREEGEEESKVEEGKEKEEESSEEGGDDTATYASHAGLAASGEELIREKPSLRLDSYHCEEQEDEALQARRTRFMNGGLVAVGIRRLSELLEGDMDKRKKKEKDDKREKEEDARRAHEGWTRVKDTRRFRLPDEEAFRPGGVWKPPRFDFSGGKGLIRPNKNLIASTTLDIMKGQGMKYAHAITDARQGVDGDLEKSKRQIKRYNKMVLQERKRRAAVRATDKVKVFRRWSRLKAITEAAIACLKSIDSPAKAGKTGPQERWLEAGRALKSVDARLLAAWTAWTDGSFAVAHCQAVWDAFRPRSCDTHSMSYSATRETFMKLLRPGVDYREAFHKVVRRRLRKVQSDLGRRFDENGDLDTDDLVLNRRELKHLLTKELGIVMRGEEMRRLMDAFETSQDRLVRWVDFEKLTGGTREAVRGDAAKRLEHRCVWETTCPVTGMPNAYTISAVKEVVERGGMNRERISDDRRRGDQLDNRPATVPTKLTTSAWGGTSEIITLKSGDRRRRNELADRTKRLRILRQYGLASPANDRAGNGRRRGEDGMENEYDDEGFEDREEDSYGEDEFERSEGEGRGGRVRGSPRRHGRSDDNEDISDGRVPCEASDWPMSKRTKGLKILKRLSKANREASELRHLLSEGIAPKPPKFWSAPPGHPDVGNDCDILTEELLLCWRPQQGSAVAFFSLEMSGPEGGKAFGQGAHREICRDPPDADGDPQYQFWVQDLVPNTRYGFRVRAFNGFGPGLYAHGCFTTRPARPAVPVVIRAAPTEVWLQWVFGRRNAAKLRELRQVFDALDEHDDGEVGRDELLASLDLHHSHLMAYLKSCPAIATTADEAEGTVSPRHAQGHGGNRWRSSGTLTARPTELGAVIGLQASSAFDAIEAIDCDYIGWEEIEQHLLHGMKATTDGNLAGAGGPVGASRTRRGNGAGHFEVDMCTSEENDRWKEVWKGTAGMARLKMLEPGRGYRFRVRPVNCEGLEGSASESTVVNTFLPTPTPPRVAAPSGKAAGTAVGDTRVRLRWDAAGGDDAATVMVGGGGGGGGGGVVVNGGSGGGGGPAVVDRAATRILKEWANDVSEDLGVSADIAFSKFDRSGRGTINPLELGNLLEALGVEVTEERLREAFTELDPGGDGIEGTLSFGDFEAWWTSGVTTFALMRDDGVAGNLLEMASADNTSSVPASAVATAVASFKGRGNCCEVAGLSPNTRYYFRVRVVTSRTRSALSAPLEVMTAPRRPESPVIIRSQQRSIIVKWYPGTGGACKYHLQAQLIEGLDGVSALGGFHRAGGDSGGRGGDGYRRRAWGVMAGGADGEKDWVTVYEGVDSTAKITGLVANSVYRFRVRGVNLRSCPSEFSFPTQAATAVRRGCDGADERAAAQMYKPQNAAEVFRVDADDDIVVGDTIIFTERLYVNINGNLFSPGPSGSSGGAGGPTPPPLPPNPSFHAPPAATSGAATSSRRVSLGTVSVAAETEGVTDSGGRMWATGPVARGVAQTTAGGSAGEFVGERTAAAHVLQDSFRLMRRKEAGGVLGYTRATSRHRILRLEVIWSTVSREEADPFLLPRGSIVERSQGRLSQFETFRALWSHDERRKSVREEWALLSGVS